MQAQKNWSGTNALSFHMAQKFLCWSKFFVSDQEFIYILCQLQIFCAIFAVYTDPSSTPGLDSKSRSAITLIQTSTRVCHKCPEIQVSKNCEIINLEPEQWRPGVVWSPINLELDSYKSGAGVFWSWSTKQPEWSGADAEGSQSNNECRKYK